MGLYFNIALFLPFHKYENKDVIIKGYIIEKIETKNDTRINTNYILYVEKFDKYKLIKKFKLKLYIDSENIFEIGDEIVLKGNFTEGEVQRNYKGFSYKNYLKQLGIQGIVNVSEDNVNHVIRKIGNKENVITIMSKIKVRLNKAIEKIYDGEIIGFQQSLLFGNKTNLEDNLNVLFQENSISHVLAISGMHVVIVLASVEKIIDKFVLNKRFKYYFEIVFLIFFYVITGVQVSCFRSVLFNIFSIINALRFDRNDIVKTLALTYVCLILFNVYNIINIGLYLSFLSSVSIMVFNNFFDKLLKNIKYFKTDIVVSISAQILIIPIMIYSFNFFSFNFLITNILSSASTNFALKVGYITVIIDLINVFDFKILKFINLILSNVITFILKCLFKLLEIVAKFKILNISFVTPNFVFIIIYYVVVIFIVYKFNKNTFRYYRRIKNLKNIKNKKALKKFKSKEIINKLNFKNMEKDNKLFCTIIIVLIVILLINNICVYFNQNGFKIFFVDVGQGDCTLIKTKSNKTILIDSGEGMSNKTDKGKQVVYPYLLDRKIKTIDYLILSHFDSDHAGGSIYLLEKLKIKNIIIGIQNEDSYLYRKVLEYVHKDDINLIVIDNLKVLKIDEGVYLDFIWPIKSELISENKLNNNSLVFRLIYNDFKIMFTGDIEIPAEEKMVSLYKDKKDRIKSDILKVAHHGSDTSTTEEFLKLVNPKIVLIGVGKNNSFNHPSELVIDRLNNYNVKIYRTDLHGEIIISYKNNRLNISEKITKNDKKIKHK